MGEEVQGLTKSGLRRHQRRRPRRHQLLGPLLPRCQPPPKRSEVRGNTLPRRDLQPQRRRNPLETTLALHQLAIHQPTPRRRRDVHTIPNQMRVPRAAQPLHHHRRQRLRAHTPKLTTLVALSTPRRENQGAHRPGGNSNPASHPRQPGNPPRGETYLPWRRFGPRDKRRRKLGKPRVKRPGPIRVLTALLQNQRGTGVVFQAGRSLGAIPFFDPGARRIPRGAARRIRAKAAPHHSASAHARLPGARGSVVDQGPCSRPTTSATTPHSPPSPTGGKLPLGTIPPRAFCSPPTPPTRSQPPWTGRPQPSPHSPEPSAKEAWTLPTSPTPHAPSTQPASTSGPSPPPAATPPSPDSRYFLIPPVAEPLGNRLGVTVACGGVP